MKFEFSINRVKITFISLVFVFLFLRCDKMIENTHEKIGESINNINKQITDSIAVSKKIFFARIAQIRVDSIDSMRFHKIEQMKINLLNTSDFIDSICVIMVKTSQN